MSPRKYPKKQIKKRHPNLIELPEEDNMDRFQIVLIGIFFLSCFACLTMFYSLDLSLFGLFKLLCLFIGISFLVPISLYRKKFTMSFYEYIIFSAISIAPAMLTLTLFTNIALKSPSYVENYKIEHIEHTSIRSIYTLENNAYHEKVYLRSIGNKDEVVVNGSSKFSIIFSDGLFGIRIIEGKQLD